MAKLDLSGTAGWACAAVLVITAMTGCHRGYYRQQADAEAYALVDENAHDPRWEIPDFNIEPDPRSRYYSPYDPDRPPMPSDDPASHRYMVRVDGKKGYKHWLDNGIVCNHCYQIVANRIVTTDSLSDFGFAARGT